MPGNACPAESGQKSYQVTTYDFGNAKYLIQCHIPELNIFLYIGCSSTAHQLILLKQ